MIRLLIFNLLNLQVFWRNKKSEKAYNTKVSILTASKKETKIQKVLSESKPIQEIEITQKIVVNSSEKKWNSFR